MFRVLTVRKNIALLAVGAATAKWSTNSICESSKKVQMNQYIDHTILKPTCLPSDIAKVCEEAKANTFIAVCVPPNYVACAVKDLKNSQVKVATVIGFPFGYSNIKAKKEEVLGAIADGADELDIVANICAIKNHDWVYLENEINQLIAPIRSSHKVVKVIIESGVLTDEEIIHCCEIYGKAGIDYLKTSTGYADKGASVHAVELFRKHLPASVQIKASGGIRDYDTALAMVQAGATRIGCSSGVAIMKGAKAEGTGAY